MLQIREERMGPHMLKLHLGDGRVLHHFTAPDMGDPHDHPAIFVSRIIQGGYVEQVFALDGSAELVTRRPGDEFEVAAEHVHRLIQLPAGECVTLVRFIGPKLREPGFWRWDDGHPFRRAWNGDWQPVALAEPGRVAAE